MSDRLALAAEVKQMQVEQQNDAAKWKEKQAKLEAKVAQLVQLNLEEVQNPENDGEACPA
tara:strand:- start:15 stop:194 length:180 start_codon:yes stop_codon:yes gene_type:complete